MFTVDKKLENDDKLAVLVIKRKNGDTYNLCLQWELLCESEYRQVINFMYRRPILCTYR
jgi:hypothetical protein